jgi:hypothetical protein
MASVILPFHALSGAAAAHPLLQAARFHMASGYHPGFIHHGYGGGSWVGHMVVSSIVHGLIYGAIFRMLAHLGLGEVLLLALIVVGALYYWNRNTGYRRRW